VLAVPESRGWHDRPHGVSEADRRKAHMPQSGRRPCPAGTGWPWL